MRRLGSSAGAGVEDEDNVVLLDALASFPFIGGSKRMFEVEYKTSNPRVGKKDSSSKERRSQ
jgi:hypothetical protein